MHNSQKINIEKIKEKLPPEWAELTIVIKEEVTSTNTLAKKYVQQNKQLPVLFIAKKQTEGRGRQGRSFYSELAHGLYFTLVLDPKEVKVADIPLYTLLTGATLAQTIELVFSLPLKIKWVNDLFYQGRKVIGILSESVWDIKQNRIGALILGAGINLSGNFEKADQQTKKIAGTLFEKIPPNLELSEFFYEFLLGFTNHQETIKTRTFLPYYEKRLLGYGQEVTYLENNKLKKGIIQGLNENGNLKVQLPNGKLDILYGQDIHFSSNQFLKQDL